MQKENKSHILFRDVYYRVFVFTELFCLHVIKYSFPCFFFFFFFFLNRTGSSDQPLCAQISGNVGEKKKAPEEKSYREDRGLIRGWRREGWTEAVRGCGCYRYLAWCQVKAQPICIYSDDGCSLSPPSLSHCLCNKSSKTTIFFHFKFILTQFPFWTISFEFKTQWKFINMFNTILLNLDFKNTHLSSKAKKNIYIWLHNKEDV